MKNMKFLIFLMMICNIHGSFNGCPIDGCDSALSGFVDINVNGFDKHVLWRRNDLLNVTSRGCVSNGLNSVLCAVNIGYVSINVTNGVLLWSIDARSENKTVPLGLPIINYQGYSIISNSTRCTLIDPQGAILGSFNYYPNLIPPLAGPFVTQSGQIIVADLNSFVGIEDSGLPLGVQPFPPGFNRLSRSMSLSWNDNRWYLIAQHNTTSSQVIIAAEITGSIVDRLRIAWIYEYDIQPNSCNGKEGPLLSMSQKWLFVANTTGILIVADDGGSATTEYLVGHQNFCANDMAYSESDSSLLVVDKNTYNIIVFNVSTRAVSYISLTTICQEDIIGQLSRMTIIQNQRAIVVAITALRQAVLLLIDYNRHSLLSRFDLGYVSQTANYDSLIQLTYTETDADNLFVTIAHQSIGIITIRLLQSF